MGRRIAIVACALLAGCGLLGLSAAVRGLDDAADWFASALMFIGCSYLTILAMVVFALAHACRGKYFYLGSVAPWLLLGTPALYHAFFGSPSKELDGFAALLWTFPGYGGLIAGPAIALLFAYAAVLRRRFAIRQRESQPAFPRARALRR